RLLAFPRHTRGTNRRGQGNYSLFNMRADLAKEDSAQVGVLAINLSDGATGVSPVSPGGDARLFTGSTSGTHGSAGKRRNPTAETIFKNTCCTGLAGRVSDRLRPPTPPWRPLATAGEGDCRLPRAWEVFLPPPAATTPRQDASASSLLRGWVHSCAHRFRAPAHPASAIRRGWQRSWRQRESLPN